MCPLGRVICAILSVFLPDMTAGKDPLARILEMKAPGVELSVVGGERKRVEEPNKKDGDLQ